MVEKSYIWSIPSRVFHALFAITILIAFLTDDDNLINYHSTVGYMVFILLVFRLFWGFFGPKYSLFRDFSLKKDELKEFSKNIFSPKKAYIGHNPAASYVMLAILITVFLVIISGILTLGVQEGKGLLSFLNSSYFKKMELFENIHEFTANLLIFLIIFHLLGVLFDRVFHSKQENLNSIFSGFKNLDNKENIKLTLFQKLIFLIFTIIFTLFLAFTLYKPNNIFIASKYEKIDYKAQNSLFVDECGSCHTLYPPNLLPKKSWLLVMQDLDDHFGDDASIDEASNKNILEFLLNNSAENSTMEASWYFMNSIGNKDIIALSKTTYWEKKHKNIPKSIFENNQVKSVANCKACHSDIEEGLIEDENIKNISTFM